MANDLRSQGEAQGPAVGLGAKAEQGLARDQNQEHQGDHGHAIDQGDVGGQRAAGAYPAADHQVAGDEHGTGQGQ